MASRMTLRVGTVGADGKREFGRVRVVRVKPDLTVLREDACRFPPCACPRHRPDLHQGGAVPARRDSPPVRSMVELWAAWRL